MKYLKVALFTFNLLIWVNKKFVYYRTTNYLALNVNAKLQRAGGGARARARNAFPLGIPRLQALVTFFEGKRGKIVATYIFFFHSRCI